MEQRSQDPPRLVTKKSAEKSETRKLNENNESEQIDKREINYEPRLSYELLNLLLALILLQLKYSKTIWHFNKFYSIAFSIHLFIVSILILFNWSTFELLYKYQLFHKHSSLNFANKSLNTFGYLSSGSGNERMRTNNESSILNHHERNIIVKFDYLTSDLDPLGRKYSNNYTSLSDRMIRPAMKSIQTDQPIKRAESVEKRAKLPFITDASLSLHLIYFLSLLVLLISSLPIYMFAIYKYKRLFRIMKKTSLRFILNTDSESKAIKKDPTKGYEDDRIGSSSSSSSSSSKEDTNLLIQNLANELYKLNANKEDTSRDSN